MAIKTYENTPYVDDFAVRDLNFDNKNAEEKNFLRILFKPGVSVQVRELNQMQSILQNQIDKVGRSSFKEGPVPSLADEATFQQDLNFVDIDIDSELTDLFSNLSYIEKIRLDYYQGAPSTSFLEADILHYEALAETNRYRFYIKYKTSVQDSDGENISEFDASTPPQVIELDNDIIINNNTLYSRSQNIGTVANSGRAGVVKVDSGTYFIKGEFVYTDDQIVYFSLPYRQYLTNIDVRFIIKEIVVNYQMDASLLDNAAGYPNATAPGADRYTIDLELVITSKNETSIDQDFIDDNTHVYNEGDFPFKDTLSLIKVENGNVVEVARPELAEIMDIMATRTKEISGDFVVDPFVIDIKEFYNDVDDENNRGIYTESQIDDLGIIVKQDDISGLGSTYTGQLANATLAQKKQYADARIVVGIEPSVAYVDGYRIAPPDKINVVVEKARVQSEQKDVYSNALLGSYVLGDTISGYPSFDVDDAAEIKDGTTLLATCKIRGLENPSSSVYRLYIYDVELEPNQDLTNADTITQSTGSFEFSIDAASGGFAVYDSEYNKSIYQLPADFISQIIGDSEFTLRKVQDPVSITEIPTEAPIKTEIILNLSGANDRFEEFGFRSFIVIDASGNHIDVDDVDLSNNNQTAKLTINSTGHDTGSGQIKVIYSYRSHGLALKTKTYTQDTETLALGSPSVINTGDEIELSNYDIHKIVSITDTASSPPLDITDKFTLDNGQRDGCYKKGKIKYIGSNTINDSIVVKYNYFSHGSGDYFSLASYGAADTGLDPITYGDIPNYKDVRLADSYDFRAKEGDGDHGTYVDPYSTIDSTIRYYLSRIDKLVATREGEFKFVGGIPGVQPDAPDLPSDSLHLYSLFLPAYTFSSKDISTDFVDNKKYTNRDIGAIESRIQNLEYYTTLSLLEREATGKQIFQTSQGNPYDRFKNGIIVDSFQSHSVGNVLDEHYNCSIDADDPVLRPYFETRSVPFGITGNSDDVDNIVVEDGLATLKYTTGPAFIDQQKAAVSISVNPYDVATWLGSVKISPSSDEWLETRRAPNIVNEVGGSLSDLRAEMDRVNQLGTQWNSWQTTWTGKPKSTRTREWRRGTGVPWGRGPGRGWLRWTTTTTTDSKQVREGIKTTASIQTVTQVKDDRVIDVSFVPFIRARKVYFKGKLFKPNTKLNVFFDGVDITKYATGIQPNQYQNWSDNPTTQVFHKCKNTKIPDAGGSIVTDFRGDVYGWFVIPNNSEHQFLAGERKVILSDGKTATDPGASTSGDAVYTAQGKVQTKQRTLITTRTLVKQEQRVSESRLQSTKKITRTQWYDPLAQSFIIGELPTGLFIHSIDLFFSHVSTKNIPLKMYIVEVENGMPTQRRVPLSDVSKQPEEVATSNDATAATTFTFDTPLYLQYGTEYAIVTESNSSEYRQWLSEVGKDDVNTGEFISKNPFLGVSFKSQNASTWTPDQNKDFKMVVRRAEYESSGSIIMHAVGISNIANDTSDGPLEFSQIQLNTDFIEHPKTRVQYQININNTGWENITPNENHYVSTVNPITVNSNVMLKVIMESEASEVSPVVDLDRISLIAVKNIIGPEDNTNETDSLMQLDDSSPQQKIDSEESNEHGNATAVYMTKEVILNNPSDRLDTYLNINKPAGANVLVYARFKRAENNIEDINFERIDPSRLIPIDDYGDYSEIRYIKDFSEDSPSPALFNSFQVKIVLVSNHHASVPTVKDFRAIATI